MTQIAWAGEVGDLAFGVGERLPAGGDAWAGAAAAGVA